MIKHSLIKFFLINFVISTCLNAWILQDSLKYQGNIKVLLTLLCPSKDPKYTLLIPGPSRNLCRATQTKGSMVGFHSLSKSLSYNCRYSLRTEFIALAAQHLMIQFWGCFCETVHSGF